MYDMLMVKWSLLNRIDSARFNPIQLLLVIWVRSLSKSFLLLNMAPYNIIFFNQLLLNPKLLISNPSQLLQEPQAEKIKCLSP